MANAWEVSESEFLSNKVMFNQLTCGQPFMDTATARNALMKSNLPMQVLSQIWGLSDLDKDGRFDVKEYSIAMKLAFNCLAGIPLPSQLPSSLLVVPARSNSIGMANIANQQSAFSGSESVAMNHAPSDGRQLDNWNIPHQNRLKYSQLFNSLDRERSGFLNSQVARNTLGMSGLTTNVLAHIWFLSDVNKDGKLSVDEYAISQYMIDMFKAGYALPKVTPPELARMCGINSRSANNTPELDVGTEPPQKTMIPKTFEDKRQDNFAKGQAELDRRRQLLDEEEQRRRAELEKREKEEHARRERERIEKERQEHAKRQAELENQRLALIAKEEEERIRREEIERRKNEEEHQRKIQAEKMKLKQMQNLKQQENERLTQRQQREKTLLFQLQALDEKTTEAELDIGKAKVAVATVTGTIEEMAENRNVKVAKIKELQEINQKTAVQSQELGHQLLQKQSSHKETTQRKNELELLRRRRSAIQKAIEEASNELVSEKKKSENQEEILKDGKSMYAAEVYKRLEARRDEYRKMFELFLHAQTHAKSRKADFERSNTAAITKSGSKPVSQDPIGTFGAENSRSIHSPGEIVDAPLKGTEDHQQIPNAVAPIRPIVDQTSSDANITYKCRALYPFEGSNSDELSFEVGDVIIVFVSPKAEPGWKAGQLKEKVGWFPEAFVETIAAVPQNTSTEPPIENMPPNMTPSASKDQIVLAAEASRKAEIATVMGTNDEIQKPDFAKNPLVVSSKCVATFQWRARNDEGLSFAKGEIIEVFEKDEMKWNGRNQAGEIGWFPKSYVKEITSQSISAKSADATTVTANQQYDVVPGETSASGEVDGEIYNAIFDYEATEHTDISLKVGDRITVINKNGDWWMGSCNGKKGMFPANYVQKALSTTSNSISDILAEKPRVLFEAKAIVKFTASADNQLALNVGDVVSVREKNATGWWEGEIKKNDHLASGWFPADYVKIIETTVNDSTGEKGRAAALFDYESTQPDELSFVTGDIIVITDNSSNDWWTGRKLNDSSKCGLFPSNYVEII